MPVIGHLPFVFFPFATGSCMAKASWSFEASVAKWTMIFYVDHVDSHHGALVMTSSLTYYLVNSGDPRSGWKESRPPMAAALVTA
jgi:hypothetical protein